MLDKKDEGPERCHCGCNEKSKRCVYPYIWPNFIKQYILIEEKLGGEEEERKRLSTDLNMNKRKIIFFTLEE